MKKLFLRILLPILCLAGTHTHAQPVPNSFQDAPDTVKVGCYFLSLHDFNFRDNEFTARFWLWLLYNNPEIDFADGVEIPNAKTVNLDAFIEDSTSGKKWVQLKMTSVVKQNWKVDDYPFDKQELKIIVENAAYDSRTVVFVPDTAGQYYDPDFVIAGWTITKFKVNAGTSHYTTGFGDASLDKPVSDYSKIMVEIDIERNAWGLFFKLFLGMYVAFAISYVSLWIDPEQAESRFALPVGGLFTAVGNKYIIDSYLPESSNFTMVDVLHGFTFVFIFIIVVFSVIALMYKRKIDFTDGKRFNKRLRLVLGVTFLVLNLAIILRAIYM